MNNIYSTKEMTLHIKIFVQEDYIQCLQVILIHRMLVLKLHFRRATTKQPQPIQQQFRLCNKELCNLDQFIFTFWQRETLEICYQKGSKLFAGLTDTSQNHNNHNSGVPVNSFGCAL